MAPIRKIITNISKDIVKITVWIIKYLLLIYLKFIYIIKQYKGKSNNIIVGIIEMVSNYSLLLKNWSVAKKLC